MSFQNRNDFGVRIGIQKGILPDEALSRSQLVPGKGIRFNYLDNADIEISSDGIVSVSGHKVVRQLSAVIQLNPGIDDDSNTPNDGFIPVSERHINVRPSDLNDDTLPRSNHFSSCVGAIVYHGWNLETVKQDDACVSPTSYFNEYGRFLWSIEDVTGFGLNYDGGLRQGRLFRVVALDSNSVIVRANTSDLYSLLNFNPSNNTFIGRCRNGYYGTSVEREYYPGMKLFARFSLMEII